MFPFSHLAYAAEAAAATINKTVGIIAVGGGGGGVEGKPAAGRGEGEPRPVLPRRHFEFD